MKHIVYQTTNLVNGKIYVGVSNGKNKNYLGSGIALKRAIEKYGWDSFERKTLFECDDGNEAYWLERIIINKEFIKFHDCYNAKVGGYSGYFHTEETRKKISKTKKKMNRPMPEHVKEALLQATKGKPLSEEHKKKIRIANSGENNWFYGGHHSEETKRKISESLKELYSEYENREKISKAIKKLWKNPEYRKKVMDALPYRKRPIVSDETREKRRQYMLGRKLSEETKRKISENNSQCKAVTMIVNDKPLLTFRSIAEASRLTGYHENSIRHVVKGRTKTTGQWFGDKFIKVKWEYEKRTPI